MSNAYRLYPLPFMDGHPLDESEWNNVLGLLEHVNRPKAKVLSAIYREHVSTSWRNYLRVYEEAYARIEELNRRLDDQREKYEQDLRMYLSKLEEREAFWEERIKQPRDEYMRLSVSVEGIQNAWPERLTRSVHGPREHWEVIQSMSRRDGVDQDADTARDGGDHPEPASAPAPAEPQPPPPADSQDGYPDVSLQVQATSDEALPALTKEEVADETQLPTFAEPPTPAWVRLVFTATLGLLAGYLVCVATGIAQPTAQAITLAAIAASVVLTGIWETTRSAAAIASEAFHLQWVGAFAKKLRAMVWFFAVLVLGTGVMQAVWLALISANTPPGGAFAHGPAATAGYLLWLTWPWFFLTAALDGFLRGRGEAVGNRIRAEVVRAKRVEAELRAPSIREDGPSGRPSSAWSAQTAGGASPSQTPTAGSAHSASEPLADGGPTEGGEVLHSSADLLRQYRAKRAEYETLRRQRDLELAFIGRRIKDMQRFLSPTHYVPSQTEQVRIEMARSDYEKVCTWFLKQLADALRDVGGGVNAGGIIQRFAEQFGMAIPGAAERDTDNQQAREFA